MCLTVPHMDRDSCYVRIAIQSQKHTKLIIVIYLWCLIFLEQVIIEIAMKFSTFIPQMHLDRIVGEQWNVKCFHLEVD